jgi:endonuclease-3
VCCIILVMVTANVEQLLNLLSADYGEKRWRPRQSPIEVLIQTILSQNTSDRNSGRAFERLVTSFASWEDMANASIGEISRSIKAGGLGEVKAGYIKQSLEEIRRRLGGFEMDFLRKLPVDEARDWLRQLPGVGMKTASCVLIFSLGMPALPVDTHVLRVAKRLGLIDSKVSAEKAHKLLEGLVPPQDVYRFHVLLIEHGRKTCKAPRPRCKECALRELCPSREM